MDTPTAVETVPTRIAEPFAGGFYAGRIFVGKEGYAVIAAPKAEGDHARIAWHKNLKRVEGARSFFDGHANTIAMADVGSPLAKWALGLKIGGFTDWYLPSRDELELCYRAFKPTTDENYCWRGDNPSSVPPGYAYSPDSPAQTAVEVFREGGAEAFESEWYWTSTQFAGGGDYAWFQLFTGGYQHGGRMSVGLRARAVRRVRI